MEFEFNPWSPINATSKSTSVWISFSLVVIIPVLIRWAIAFTNSVSDIASVAHHPAVFFTHSGIPLDVSVVCDVSTCMIFSFTRNSIAFTNSVSDIASVAHHPAVFFTHSGTSSANALGIINPDREIRRSTGRRYFIL